MAEKNINNPTEQQRHLTRCETEVERLDTMIAEVLTLSRLEHSSQKIIHQPVQLSLLSQKIIDDCQYIANAKDIKISLTAPPHCSINGDEKLLNSALSNIINNAVKYSPNNGTISVDIIAEHKHIRMVITDQGTGVPSNMVDKIFQPFFRVADARDRRSGGTGLGLAIVKQAIAHHHGTVTAQNITPHGLQVTITLPIN